MNAWKGDRELRAPESWWINLDGHGRRIVYLACPRGHVGDLTGHVVAWDGYVSPSVVCREPGCDFHDMVRLEGWEP